MRTVYGALALTLSLISLAYLAASGLRTAHSLTRVHLRLQAKHRDTYNDQQSNARIEGEYQRFRAELGLVAILSDAVFSPSSSLPDSAGVQPQSYPSVSINPQVAASKDSDENVRVEASNLSSELQDEQWHEIGLRKMQKRSATFGLAPESSLSEPNSSLVNTIPPAKPSEDHQRNTPIPPPSRNTYSSSPSRLSSSSAQLFLSTDSVREPRTSLARILTDYSNFSSAQSGGRSSSSAEGSSSSTKNAQSRNSGSSKAKSRRRARSGRRRTVRLEH